MLKFVFLALLVSCVAAGNIDSGACGGSATFHSAAIEGCSGSGACTVTKGKSTPIDIAFTPTSQITGGKYTITATYIGLTVTIVDKDLSAGISLPIGGGSQSTHTHLLTLASNILSIQAPATLKITDQNGNLILCRTVTIKIVD